jgi:hypothetical protein
MPTVHDVPQAIMDTTLVYQQATGLDMEGCVMNQDDDEDFFIDMLKTFLGVGFVVLVVVTVGAVVWELIA